MLFGLWSFGFLTFAFFAVMLSMWITWGVYNADGTSAPVNGDTLQIYQNTAIAFTVLFGVALLIGVGDLGSMMRERRRHHKVHAY